MGAIMKIKSLVVAVAASVAASQAFALNPTQSLNATLKLNVSGATAADKQFDNYITQICDPATLDRYTNTNDDASVFSCEIKAGEIAGVSGGTTAMFRKESGGSCTGVTPVINNTTVPGLDLSTCTEDAQNPGNWSCSNTTIQVPTEVGISDVEPELFTIPANSCGAISNPANVNLLKVGSVNAQTFGIVVTPDLRDALQASQNLSVGSDEVSEMPSLSSSIVANLFAGNVELWSELGVSGVSSDNVEICRRTNGSGTQAQFNAFYMQNPCTYRGASSFEYLGFATKADTSSDSGVNDIDIPTFFGVPVAAPYIHENQGSSDLGKCLTNLAAAGRTGVGIQSLEKVDEGRTDRNNFKYVAIDGVTPTLENLQAGLYRNWASLSIQYRTDVVTGIKAAAADKFIELAQDVSAVSDFNASLQDDDPANSSDDRPLNGFRTTEILDGGVPANVGTLAFAKASQPATAVWTAGNPVFSFNKADGLSNPSTCAATRITSGQVIDTSYQN